jgi:hypothetical protein
LLALIGGPWSGVQSYISWKQAKKPSHLIFVVTTTAVSVSP